MIDGWRSELIGWVLMASWMDVHVYRSQSIHEHVSGLVYITHKGLFVL